MTNYARLLPMLALPALLLSDWAIAGNCSGGTALTGNQIATAFNDKTITFDCQTQCAGWMASTTTDWHEEHKAPTGGFGTPGDLFEIGTGTGGIQPTKKVGTWTISGDIIDYDYGNSQVYLYAVDQLTGALGASGSTYAFCQTDGGPFTYKAIGTID